ncbi:RDD family protein [Halomicroarcula sp. F28]|uniref:RDD family protein n=1 Tax=Haloarcula salinisoli TaxID=2487746 RepID=UPI001C730F2C|nr:RDD family protein [Halomicroarcula salinisoli]MBX0287311.1 RDD family protein [Halomicroarcula salinisoli]
MSKLTLFGMFTFSRARSLQTELDGFLSGEDALVVQYGETVGLRDQFRAMLKFPVLMIGTWLTFLFLWAPLELLLTRSVERFDRETFRTIAGDRPVHFVDDYSLTGIGEREWAWLLCNWAVLLLVAVWDWHTVLLLAGLSLTTTIHDQLRNRLDYPRLGLLALGVGFATALWLLVAGYLNGLSVGALVVSSLVMFGLAGRGEADRLLDDVAALVADEEYDEVCLVTEKSTVTDLLDIVDGSDLTVADAFHQRWRRQGHHVDATGEPVDASPHEANDEDEPLLRHVGDTAEDRVEARLLDWFLLVGLLTFVGMAELAVVLFLKLPLGFDIDFGAPVIAGSGVDLGHLWLASLLVPLMAYYTVSEGLWGRTFGKHRMGLRVRHTDGSAVGLRSAAVRTLAGWIDVLPVAFIIGGLLAEGHRHGRRIGDLAAGTVVVEESLAREYAAETVDTRPDQPSAVDTDGESSPDDHISSSGDSSPTPAGDGTETAEDTAPDEPSVSDGSSVTEPESTWPEPENDRE